MRAPAVHPAGTGPADAPVLLCAGLRRSFGELTAVDGVSFAIAAGETYGLLGPNGAGKTTTILMVAGVLAPDAGTVRVDRTPMTTRAVGVRGRIGYVPQEIAVYPDLTGRENLRFFARLYGPRPGRGEGPGRRGPRPHRAERSGRRPGQDLLGWHAAPVEHRRRAAAPAPPADPRRADGRRRSAEPQRDPARCRGAGDRGHGGAVHHALHGGGPAAVRPGRRGGRRAVDRRGYAPRTDQPGRRVRPGAARRDR